MSKKAGIGTLADRQQDMTAEQHKAAQTLFETSFEVSQHLKDIGSLMGDIIKLREERDYLLDVLLAAEKMIACPMNKKLEWEGAWANMIYAVDVYRKKYKDNG